jgi:hypothetical protein
MPNLTPKRLKANWRLQVCSVTKFWFSTRQSFCSYCDPKLNYHYCTDFIDNDELSSSLPDVNLLNFHILGAMLKRYKSYPSNWIPLLNLSLPIATGLEQQLGLCGFQYVTLSLCESYETCKQHNKCLNSCGMWCNWLAILSICSQHKRKAANCITVQFSKCNI